MSHCVRASGEQIDPSLSPAPSVLCEDGRGTLYALGADGTVRASPARHVNAAARGAVDPRDASTLTPNGGADRSGRAVETFRPDPPIDFEPRTLCVSPSGRFAAIGGLRHAVASRDDSESLAPPSSALAVVSLRSRAERDSAEEEAFSADDPDDPRCARVSLLEDEFASHHSVRVLRAQWHPNGDGHLVILLSDNTLRVFDAGTNVATHESAYRLDPWGRGDVIQSPSPYPLRPEIVDFAFAPPHGWGALALILLGREGDVYTLCPFAPAGVRFPRVTLEALARQKACGDARAEVWLAAAFPSLFALRSSRATRAYDDDVDGLPSHDDEPDGLGYDDDSDDDGRNEFLVGGVRDDDDGYDVGGGATVAAKRCEGIFFESGSRVAPALRGPLPLGTDPVEGDDDAGGGALGRGAVARCLAVAPFAAGEGGGALLAVAHQRAGPSGPSGGGGGVSATLDVLILPQEPSPGWARVETPCRSRATERTFSRRGLSARGDAYGYLDDDDDDDDDATAISLTPPVDDDDEGALPPLLAIDRVRLVATRSADCVAGSGSRSRAAAAANELAPFVSAAFDPGCRERVFCCAGGAVHAVTLTWLAQVEGAVDEDDEDEDDFSDARGGYGKNETGSRLPLPAVVTLLDSSHALLGVAPVGDPLAEGLVLAVDVAGNAEALHPAPPLPPEREDSADETAEAETLRRSLAAAAEASAELRALCEGPEMSSSGVPAFSGSQLQPGTLEGNSELARAATALKERHLRFAHRVHAACRRHGARLGVEVARQKAEARMLREGLASVLQRRESLLRRLERAKAAHADARERLRALAETERSFPRPATAAENAFRVTLRAAEDDAPLLRAKLDELKRRMDAVRAETGDLVDLKASASTGAGRGGDARVAKPDQADAAVREELRAQEAAIRRNAARAEALASR